MTFFGLWIRIAPLSVIVNELWHKMFSGLVQVQILSGNQHFGQACDVGGGGRRGPADLDPCSVSLKDKSVQFLGTLRDGLVQFCYKLESNQIKQNSSNSD